MSHTNAPAVSVVIPFHNVERYVGACLQSVVQQSLHDVEILCVDDASSDGSADIVREFQSRDPRISLLKHEVNRGLGGARNTGISHARGSYIASVDSDDYMGNGMLSCLFETAVSGDFDIVEMGYHSISEDGSPVGTFCAPPAIFTPQDADVDIFKVLRPSFWSKIWRRSLFERTGIRFPERTYFEDLATTPKLVYSARRICRLDAAHYYYRQRPGSIMTTYGPKHVFDYFRVFEELRRFLAVQGAFERYQVAFRRAVQANVHYHATCVLASKESSTNDMDVTTYLRYLAQFQQVYLQQHGSFADLTAAELVERIRSGGQAGD